MKIQASLRKMVPLAVLLVLVAAPLAVATPAAAVTNVSVIDFGAVGDGVTNDRDAIQGAIDAVSTAGGGVVLLPGGTTSAPRTYLTGNVVLKSHVTLEIGADAVLKQSQDPADYANTPTRGRVIPGSTVAFITYLDQNYPLIYAGASTDVHVTGAGEIALTRGFDDPNSVLVHGIGFFDVSDYTISGVTISGASAYNITMRSTKNGEISNVTITAPATLNSDGISLMNSSHISVHDNSITTLDDGIYVWASYDDPRASAWWNSATPRPSHDIEVYNNVVDNQATNGSHGFLFINWTAAAPDKSAVEVSNINVHDNTFAATYPIGALNGDIYHPSIGDKTPSKWLRFVDNTLKVNPGSGGAFSTGLSSMATTDLETDDPTVFNFATSTNASGMYNQNFDGANAWPSQVGLSFWSTEGTTSAPMGTTSGRYGEIAGYSAGYSSITQGVYLETGTYTFSADLQTSGASFRLLAVQAAAPSAIASNAFSTTSWTTTSLNFTVTTPGNYRLGIDNVNSLWDPASFGRIDNTTLVKTS